MSNRERPTSKIEVVHPVYLDVPMLISFLATLDDGVAFSSEIAETHANSAKSTGEGSGAAKLPGLASLLGLSLSASGRYTRDKATDQSIENKFVRQHTAASLFNRLRTLLHGTGDLVEVSGQIEMSPLEKIVNVFDSILPFMKLETAQQTTTESPESIAETESIIDLIRSDFQRSSVADILLQRPDISVLVTASREYFSEDVNSSVLGGTFTLIGKVSSVDSAPNAELSTVRRGAMGIIAEATVGPMLSEIQANMVTLGINLDVPNTKLTGPYMQIIPLAIFV